MAKGHQEQVENKHMGNKNILTCLKKKKDVAQSDVFSLRLGTPKFICLPG